MDFIIDEAEVSDEIDSENSDESDNENLLDHDFLVLDQNFENESTTFYRKFDNLPKFLNQQKNADLELRKNHDVYFGEDGQPEMFAPESIDHVEFHDFSDYKKKLSILKKLYCVFHQKLNQIYFFRLWFMRFHICKRM